MVFGPINGKGRILNFANYILSDNSDPNSTGNYINKIVRSGDNNYNVNGSFIEDVHVDPQFGIFGWTIKANKKVKITTSISLMGISSGWVHWAIYDTDNNIEIGARITTYSTNLNTNSSNTSALSQIIYRNTDVNVKIKAVETSGGGSDVRKDGTWFCIEEIPLYANA